MLARSGSTPAIHRIELIGKISATQALEGLVAATSRRARFGRRAILSVSCESGGGHGLEDGVNLAAVRLNCANNSEALRNVDPRSNRDIPVNQ
jgi:hypothetical protein